ncbi:hypothetical protein TCAL_07261 [Tigriopus californicus]|uniref:Maelstrom domain-containing protein n=1 Tax=Tigriopus californicus TaxID=6832 RepID=A0A553NEM0_TIGCA|nr:hypothetical protein TCAL_07261 [Tigriopus californicus]
MGPKKKQIYNDFFFFMQDQKAILREEGRTWKDMPELVAICGPKWQLIFDSTGRSLVSIEKEKQTALEKRNDMLHYIGNLVKNSVRNGTLGQETLFFIHMNMICEIDDVRFLPGEVALCEFSIENGVTRIFETFIKPWNIPLGYGYNIRKVAETTHRIHMDSTPMCHPLASDYDRLFKGLLDFLCQNEDFDHLPPIYTLSDQVPKVEAALLEWQEQTTIRKRINWSIYSVDELYFSLSEALPSPRAKLYHATLAKDRLEHDCYMFSQEMACPYHVEVDCNHHCSQFNVQKWAFIIAEHCCDFLKYKPIPGAHKPLDCAQGYDIIKYSRPDLYPLLRNEEASYDPIQNEQSDGRPANSKITRSTPSGVHYLPNEFEKLNVKTTFSTHGNEEPSIKDEDCETDVSSILSGEFPVLNASRGSSSTRGNGYSSRGTRGWAGITSSSSVVPNPPSCDNEDQFPTLGGTRRVLGGQRGRGFGGRGRRGRY